MAIAEISSSCAKQRYQNDPYKASVVIIPAASTWLSNEDGLCAACSCHSITDHAEALRDDIRVMVHFKHRSCLAVMDASMWTLFATSDANSLKGRNAIVTGDRGEDLGFVLPCALSSTKSKHRSDQVSIRVIRVANDSDIASAERLRTVEEPRYDSCFSEGWQLSWVNRRRCLSVGQEEAHRFGPPRTPRAISRFSRATEGRVWIVYADEAYETL